VEKLEGVTQRWVVIFVVVVALYVVLLVGQTQFGLKVVPW
jgi:hypothetical protein